MSSEATTTQLNNDQEQDQTTSGNGDAEQEHSSASPTDIEVEEENESIGRRELCSGGVASSVKSISRIQTSQSIYFESSRTKILVENRK